jgi:transposase
LARGARYVERLMMVAGSGKLQGRHLLDFLSQAIQAHWGKGTMPSLVPDSVAG